jgi:hypothetical protein
MAEKIGSKEDLSLKYVPLALVNSPATKPIVKKLFPKLFPSTTGGSRSASHGTYPSGSRSENTPRRCHRDIIVLSFYLRLHATREIEEEVTIAVQTSKAGPL